MMMDVNTSEIQIANPSPRSLAQLFYQHALSTPTHPALVIQNISFTYAELAGRVRQIVYWLKTRKIKRIGILASRSLEAYASVLAAHWIGITYVPLNPAFPQERLQHIITKAELDGIILDENHSTFQTKEESILLIHEMQALPSGAFEPIDLVSTDIAYLIFTSGTSGEPKGVPISFGNLGAFIGVTQSRYHLTPADRISQFSNLSFDVSLFDMILAWTAGATLYVVPEEVLLAPARFIQDNEITSWLSVPSVITVMQKLKMLQPKSFPSLKYSLFTGEALTLGQVEAWQQSAIVSEIENLYGPTEATIDCMAYRHDEKEKINYYHQQVPIGVPFPDVYAALINSEKIFLPAGETGELVIAGAQTFSAYWRSPALSQEKFIELQHPDWGWKTWYLTGDICYQDVSGVFYYLERLDNQCKILGQRIELEEIENEIRKITSTAEVAAVLIKRHSLSDPEIIVAINCHLDSHDLKKQLRTALPGYMIPAHIIYIAAFPYNSNGKLDRKQLSKEVSRVMYVSFGDDYAG
jgi:D-alanine--poly(phosphoribitol) ligase subunit 1